MQQKVKISLRKHELISFGQMVGELIRMVPQMYSNDGGTIMFFTLELEKFGFKLLHKAKSFPAGKKETKFSLDAPIAYVLTTMYLELSADDDISDYNLLQLICSSIDQVAVSWKPTTSIDSSVNNRHLTSQKV